MVEMMVEMVVEVVEIMVEEDISQLYFPCFHFLFLSSFDFSPFLLFLAFFLFFCFLNFKRIGIWRSFWFLKRSCNKCEV